MSHGLMSRGWRAAQAAGDRRRMTRWAQRASGTVTMTTTVMYLVDSSVTLKKVLEYFAEFARLTVL